MHCFINLIFNLDGIFQLFIFALSFLLPCFSYFVLNIDCRFPFFPVGILEPNCVTIPLSLLCGLPMRGAHFYKAVTKGTQASIFCL